CSASRASPCRTYRSRRLQPTSRLAATRRSRPACSASRTSGRRTASWRPMRPGGKWSWFCERSGPMSKKLEGQAAVVTGASKGIGAAIAEHLAAAGAAVVVNYAKSSAGAEEVVKRIRQAGGKALAVQADVSKLDDVRRLFAETMKAFGKLDILVNNAGIYEF